MSIQAVTGGSGSAMASILRATGREPELALELIRKTVASMATGGRMAADSRIPMTGSPPGPTTAGRIDIRV